MLKLSIKQKVDKNSQSIMLSPFIFVRLTRLSLVFFPSVLIFVRNEVTESGGEKKRKKETLGVFYRRHFSPLLTSFQFNLLFLVSLRV